MFRAVSVAVVGLALAAVCACSSDSDGGGAAGAAAGSGGSSGGGGSGGGAVDIHCEQSGSDDCLCVGDPNGVWGPEEGIKTCKESSVGLGNGFCCASSSYPDSGTCSCQAWGCFEGGACTCGIGYGNEPATSCSKPWTTCCVHEVGGAVSLCDCSNSTSCSSGYDPVTSCGIAQARCRTGEVMLSSCTFD